MAIYLPVEIVAKLQPRNFRYLNGKTQLLEEGMLWQPIHVRLPAGNLVIIDPAALVADGDKEIEEAIKKAPPAKDWNGKER